MLIYKLENIFHQVVKTCFFYENSLIVKWIRNVFPMSLKHINDTVVLYICSAGINGSIQCFAFISHEYSVKTVYKNFLMNCLRKCFAKTHLYTMYSVMKTYLYEWSSVRVYVQVFCRFTMSYSVNNIVWVYSVSTHLS